jgi:hypothetical protein
MPIDQRDDLRIERDFAAARSETLTERLNQSIFGLLPMRIVLVGPRRSTIRVTPSESRKRQRANQTPPPK